MMPTVDNPGRAPVKAIELRDRACMLLGTTAVELWRVPGKGKSPRAQSIADKRGQVFAFIRASKAAGLGYSYPEIAAACGLRNHSTVITAIKRNERLGKSSLPEISECL